MIQPIAMSKKYKLPKEFWVKGKSKFLYPRMVQEGIPFGIDRWDGTRVRYSATDLLYMKLRGQTISLLDVLKKKGMITYPESSFSKLKKSILGK